MPPTVADDLSEQPVVVADAVAVGGNAERGHALHEAGREPAEAATAQRRVGLGGAQAVEVDAEIAERGAELLDHPEIAEHVGEQPPDQEFERDIERLWPSALLVSSAASQRWTMRSRSASAAATNQSRSVAEPASLPTVSASLATPRS